MRPFPADAKERMASTTAAVVGRHLNHEIISMIGIDARDTPDHHRLGGELHGRFAGDAMYVFDKGVGHARWRGDCGRGVRSAAAGAALRRFSKMNTSTPAEPLRRTLCVTVNYATYCPISAKRRTVSPTQIVGATDEESETTLA